MSDSKPDAKKPIPTSKALFRPRPRDRRTPIEPLEVPPEPATNPIEIVEIPLDSLPPKTPAGADPFSPPSTKPSTARPESKDTPPPGDLNPSATSTDQASAAGRTARRARAPVNYAEPNLISKMRRPTKELVDAVVPDGRRSMSAKPDEASAPPTTVEKEKAKLRTAVIEREGDEGDGSAWKSLPSAAGGSAGAADDVGEPNSPLSKKTARQSQGQGQGQGQAQDEAPAGPPTLNSSAAANAISALISASATSRRRPVAQASNPEPEKRPVPPDPLGERKEKEKEKEKQSHLAVFDFTDSSPQDTASGRPRVDLAKQAQAGRRHSSVPASAAGALPAVSAKRGAGVRSVSAAGVAASREREREREREKGSREVRQAKSSAPLRSSNSSCCSSSSSTVNSGAGDESGGEKGSGRGERAAARRRSMML